MSYRDMLKNVKNEAFGYKTRKSSGQINRQRNIGIDRQASSEKGDTPCRGPFGLVWHFVCNDAWCCEVSITCGEL